MLAERPLGAWQFTASNFRFWPPADELASTAGIDPLLTDARVGFRASNYDSYASRIKFAEELRRRMVRTGAKLLPGGLMETLTNDSMSDHHPFGVLGQIYVHGHCLTKDYQG